MVHNSVKACSKNIFEIQRYLINCKHLPTWTRASHTAFPDAFSTWQEMSPSWTLATSGMVSTCRSPLTETRKSFPWTGWLLNNHWICVTKTKTKKPINLLVTRHSRMSFLDQIKIGSVLNFQRYICILYLKMHGAMVQCWLRLCFDLVLELALNCKMWVNRANLQCTLTFKKNSGPCTESRGIIARPSTNRRTDYSYYTMKHWRLSTLEFRYNRRV